METSLVHSSPSPRADRPASSLADNSQGTTQPGGWGLVSKQAEQRVSSMEILRARPKSETGAAWHLP